MTKDIEKIVNTATRLNACRRVLGITDMESAISTLLTPQGREFAMRTGYPSLATFRDNLAEVSQVYGVYVDAGKCICAAHDIVAAGDTDLTAIVSGTERLYHVMAMHGARVRIDARDHAVVTATSIGGDIEITNDGTAAINIEEP